MSKFSKTIQGVRKETLKMAGEIIQGELEDGNEVKIPGFGKLYLSRVNWVDNDTGEFGKVNTVRFRPFKGLKAAVGNREMLGILGDDGTKRLPEPDEAPKDYEPKAVPAPVLTLYPRVD